MIFIIDLQVVAVAGVGDPGHKLYSLLFHGLLRTTVFVDCIHFQLGAHLLDLCGLLFELRGESCHFLLQFLHFLVLFEKFIEQHRVHLVVANGVGLAFFVEHHQVGICFRYVLGDQTELPAPLGVVLVVEGNRLESQNSLARLIHRFNIVLESPRRGLSAKPTRKIDSHWEIIGVNRRFKDIADIEAVAHVPTEGADTDHVVGCIDEEPAFVPSAMLSLPVLLASALTTNCGVIAPRVIGFQRSSPNSCIGVAPGVLAALLPSFYCFEERGPTEYAVL